MSPIRIRSIGQCKLPWRAQVGHAMVEFAIVILVFLTFVFGVMEVARLMYLWNTLQEVTRRAAAGAARVDFQNEPAKALVRQSAVFRTSAGKLLLGNPVTDEHVRIDYLALVRAADGTQTLTPILSASLPSSPARNRLNCTFDPNGANCIRFVRVRMCEPGSETACDAIRYIPLVPLISLPIDLPKSATIVSAESLGYTPGMALTP